VDRLPSNRDLPLVLIDDQTLELERSRIGRIPLLRQAFDAAEDGLHSRHQLADVEWFGEVIVGAELEAEAGFPWLNTRAIQLCETATGGLMICFEILVM
jgi:hypothetical protein